MAIWRLFSGACAEWIPNTAYSLGARVVCRTAFPTQARRKWVWECTTAGTSHASTEPTWPDGPVGQTVGDNDIVWTCRLSNDGNWLNAHCYLGWLLQYSGVAAGDFVYVHKTHAESRNWGASHSLYGSATKTNPIYIFCVDKDNSDALSVGATVYNNSVSYYLYLLQWAYSYGVQYKGLVVVGSSTAAAGWVLEGDGTIILIYETNSDLRVGSSANYPAMLMLINGDVYISSPTDSISTYTGGTGIVHWKKGTLQLPAAGIYRAVNISGGNLVGRFEDVDFSQLSKFAGTAALVKINNIQAMADLLFSRCKLPSSNFQLFEGTPAQILTGRVRIHHCSHENKYYDFCERSSFGQIDDEIVIVRTNGASDGTTPQSWKMVSSAFALEAVLALESPPINIWGAYAVEKTFTVEGIWDSAVNIQNNEIWMELEYPADASSGQGAVSRIKCAPLGTPSDVPASTAAWTTSGMTNPNKFKFQATVTPGKEGPVTARIYLAKPSTTVYIDPLITVS